MDRGAQWVTVHGVAKSGPCWFLNPAFLWCFWSWFKKIIILLISQAISLRVIQTFFMSTLNCRQGNVESKVCLAFVFSSSFPLSLVLHYFHLGLTATLLIPLKSATCLPCGYVALVHCRDFVEPNGNCLKWSLSFT